MLDRELRDAGFARVRVHEVPTRLRYTRDQALEWLRGRSASSFALMAEEEIAAGIERAERTLPPEIEPLLERLIVVADGPGLADSRESA